MLSFNKYFIIIELDLLWFSSKYSKKLMLTEKNKVWIEISYHRIEDEMLDKFSTELWNYYGGIRFVISRWIPILSYRTKSRMCGGYNPYNTLYQWCMMRKNISIKFFHMLLLERWILLKNAPKWISMKISNPRYQAFSFLNYRNPCHNSSVWPTVMHLSTSAVKLFRRW